MGRATIMQSYRARKKALGLSEVSVWVFDHQREEVRRFADKLRDDEEERSRDQKEAED